MFPSRRIAVMGSDKFRDEYSVSFDGTNDYIKVPHSSDLNFSGGDFSLTCWAKIPNGTTSEKLLDKWLVHSGEGGWFMYISSSGTLRTRMEDGSGLNNATLDGVGDYIVFSGSTSIDTDKWVFLTITYDADGDITLYVDGVNDGSNSNASALGAIDTSYDLHIGTNQTNQENFDGKISEVAIYNTALSASQVKTLYNGREPYNHKEGIASGNLKAWYRMGDGTLDQKSNAHSHTGIICDEVNPTLGSDLLGGKGDFSDASYWNTTASHSEISGGLGKLLGTGTYGVISKGSLTTSGKMYCVDIDCVSNAGASVRQNNTDHYPMLVPDSETGSFRAYYLANGTSFIMYSGENYTSIMHIDNVILREVGGNPGAMINMAPSDLTGDTP